MSGHTPGPWLVVPPSAERPSRAMVGTDEVTIYDVPLTRQTEANARLIAAAPELLQLVEVAVCAIHSLHWQPFDVCPDAFCMEARATLASAKGETP
jgi:hypothetical protein